MDAETTLEELLGKTIELFGFDDGIIYLKTDDGRTYMFSIKRKKLYVEVYDYPLQ